MTVLTPPSGNPGAASSAPYSTGSDGPRFTVPAGACDCHMHLFDTSRPFARGPVLKHSDATSDDYLKLQNRLRLQRNVLVQPSSYARDHSVLLAGLRALGPQSRGVAVIDPATTSAELETLRAAGVVGVRFNLVQAGATSEDMLEGVATLIRPLGWHLQVHALPEDLLRLANRLLALPVPIVLDHYARLNTEPEVAPKIALLLSRMLSSQKVWLKLSAPYIASPEPRGYEKLGDLVRQLARAHIDRLVWGTDWPHVTEPSHAKPDDAALMNWLAHWLSEDEIQQVLVTNPAQLYQFDRQS